MFYQDIYKASKVLDENQTHIPFTSFNTYFDMDFVLKHSQIFASTGRF